MKHRMRKLQIAISLSVMLVLLVTSLASAAVPTFIDHFDNGPTSSVPLEVLWSHSEPRTESTFTNDTSILGGQRDIVLTLDDGNGTGGVRVYVSDGSITIDSDNYAFFTTEFQWDGTTDTADRATLIKTGLTGSDANFASGDRDRFVFGIPSSDQIGLVQVIVHQDATHCRSASFETTGGISSGNQRIFELLYTDFAFDSAECSNDMTVTDFTQVGALVVRTISLADAAWDLKLELLATTASSYRDFGDLPDGSSSPTYKYDRYRGTNNALYHAQHVDSGLYLGAGMTTETAKPSPLGTTASSDTDDGITLSGQWKEGTVSSGNGGKITFTVSGCASTCYLSGIIDWNGNGSFWTALPAPGAYDANERVFNNVAVTNNNGDPQDITFDIPTISGGLGNKTLFSRFRLTDTPAILISSGVSPWGVYYSGEVEDYQLIFGPNAVTLAKFGATSPLSPVLPFAGLLFPVGIGLLLASRRRRK